MRLPDLDGRQSEPLRAKDAKAIVFIFIRTDCPSRIATPPKCGVSIRSSTNSGVRFCLVYPDPGESSELIRTHIKEHEYLLSPLRDPQHKLVKLTAVQVTPEAAVFSPGGRMFYRGRIDNRYVAFGKARPAPTTRDLEQVLDGDARRKAGYKTTTTAIGCFIPDLR